MPPCPINQPRGNPIPSLSSLPRFSAINFCPARSNQSRQHIPPLVSRKGSLPPKKRKYMSVPKMQCDHEPQATMQDPASNQAINRTNQTNYSLQRTKSISVICITSNKFPVMTIYEPINEGSNHKYKDNQQQKLQNEGGEETRRARIKRPRRRRRSSRRRSGSACSRRSCRVGTTRIAGR